MTGKHRKWLQQTKTRRQNQQNNLNQNDMQKNEIFPSQESTELNLTLPLKIFDPFNETDAATEPNVQEGT